MLKRWSFIALLISLCCAPALANFAIFQVNGGGVANQPTTFTHVQVGGAGLVTGVSAVPSTSLLLARTDQFGCYKSVSNAQWLLLITTTAMPAGSVTAADGGPNGDTGCAEIVGDIVNTNNLWIGYKGNVYFSSNLGTAFTLTCYPHQATDISNSDVRGMGRRIAIDPANSNIAYMSTPASTLQRTVDQGSTCASVASGTLGTPTSCCGGGAPAGGGYLIAFDTSAGTLSGASCPSSVSPCTKNIYVSSYGSGVYKSTDAGATFTLTTSTPTTHWYMIADPTGVVWFVDNIGGGGSNGTARKFNGTTWSAPSFTSNGNTSAVAYDPNNCTLTSNCHVTFMVCCGINAVANSVNGGSTWVVSSGISIVTTDLPWLTNTATTLGMFPTGAVYDGSGQVYTGSEGVFKTTPPTTATTLTYTSQTAGIEEFLTNQIASSPGTSGSIIVAGWDMGCFTLTAPYTSFPTNGNHGCNGQSVFQHGYDLDWAAGTATTFVSLVDNQLNYGVGTYVGFSGASTNSGSTWPSKFTVPTAVAAPNGLTGGCMAVGTSPATIMWAPTDGSGGNVAPLYSSDSGATWTAITVSGVTQGWPWRYFLNSHQCAADRVTANTFYFYNWNTGSGSPSDGIIKCTGTSCTRVSSPGLGGNAAINPIIKTVPGQAGYIFLSGGVPGGTNIAANSGFYFSSNGGTTVNTIANATAVTAFGFGAAFPGHTFPAVVFAGWYNNVYGIWRSIDWDGAQTWQNIGTYPMNIPLPINNIEGDKGIQGVFFYGTISGIFCGALSTAQCNGST